MSQYHYDQSAAPYYYPISNYSIPTSSGYPANMHNPQTFAAYSTSQHQSYIPRRPAIGSSQYDIPVAAPSSRNASVPGVYQMRTTYRRKRDTYSTRVNTRNIATLRTRDAYTPAPVAKTPSGAWNEWTARAKNDRRSSRHEKTSNQPVSTAASRREMSPIRRSSRSSRNKYDRTSQASNLGLTFSKMRLSPDEYDYPKRPINSHQKPSRRHTTQSPVPGSSGRGSLYEKDMEKRRRPARYRDKFYLPPAPDAYRSTPGHWPSGDESDDGSRRRKESSSSNRATPSAARRHTYESTSRTHTDDPPTTMSSSERYRATPTERDVRGKRRSVNDSPRGHDEVLSVYLTSWHATISCDYGTVPVNVWNMFAFETESIPGQRARDAYNRQRGRRQPERRHRYWEIVRVGASSRSSGSHALKVEIREIHDSPLDRIGSSSIPQFGAPYVYRSLISRKSESPSFSQKERETWAPRYWRTQPSHSVDQPSTRAGFSCHIGQARCAWES